MDAREISNQQNEDGTFLCKHCWSDCIPMTKPRKPSRKPKSLGQTLNECALVSRICVSKSIWEPMDWWGNYGPNYWIRKNKMRLCNVPTKLLRRKLMSCKRFI